MSVVEEHAEQLDGRLRSVLLQRRHVHVVHEDDGFLADGRPVDAFTSLVHLRHDDELATAE